MRSLLFAVVVIVAASYFVEWIPNNATASQTPPPVTSPGEFPWQL